MTAGLELGQLWRRIAIWTTVLVAATAIPLLAFGLWRVALGAVLGAGLLVGDIYLLKAPLELMLGRLARGKSPWVLAITMARIVILAAVLLVMVKFRIANVAGLLIGATLPLVAIGVLLATGRIKG